MGFTNAEQLWEAFLSGGMGFLLGAYYDVFRIWRKITHPSVVSVFFQDCLFFSTSAVVVFLFSLAMTDGVVRAYVLLGVLAGGLAYRHTVGNALLSLIGIVMRWMKWCYGQLCRLISVPVVRMKRAVRFCFGKVWKICRKGAKKSKNFFKKGLQPVRKLLYNRTV